MLTIEIKTLKDGFERSKETSRSEKDVLKKLTTSLEREVKELKRQLEKKKETLGDVKAQESEERSRL